LALIAAAVVIAGVSIILIRRNPPAAASPTPAVAAPTKPPPAAQIAASDRMPEAPKADMEVVTQASTAPAVIPSPASSPVQHAAEEIVSHRDAGTQNLVIEDLDKDTYNVFAELRSLLETQAWNDAASLIASADPRTARGIAPSPTDKALLTTLPAAIEFALDQYPQLRQALGDRFARLANLRVNQAIAAADVATLELATVQFSGNEAAGQAHRWLGNRALGQGWFAAAVSHYKQAQQAQPTLSTDLAPRLRLAAAMLGREEGQPAIETVHFGEVSYSAAEFEALVAEMRGRQESRTFQLVADDSALRQVPTPGDLEVKFRSRLDGPTGDRPQEEVRRGTNQYRVPWADRQVAVAVSGQTMYVANRFQVAAYNMNTGERIWQSQSPSGSMQRSQEWTAIPMYPLIVGDRIFVRLLYSPSPLLVCLDKSSGKLLWTAQSRERESFVSDPQLIQDQIVVLAMDRQEDQQCQLQWNVFDSRSGELLRQRDLLKLRNSWTLRACCQVAPHDDGLVVSLGGATAGLDASGTIRWIRMHPTTSADDDPKWIQQMYQRPLLSGDRVYLAQPAVRAIDCLAMRTGHQHWTAAVPDVQAIIGLTSDLVVIRTDTGFSGLDIEGGQTRWQHPAENIFTFHLLDDERLLFASHEPAPGQTDRQQVRLTWLEPATGKDMATTVISELAADEPHFGPLIPYRGHIFAFFGRAEHDPTRDIVELIPTGKRL
jgi:outer membrane protein assembly factor BamB